MTFFKLIFLAAVLFFIINVRVAHAGSSVPNHVSTDSLCKEGIKHRNPVNHSPDLTEPGFRDVVINEIMADPSPPTSLPDAEFIEILNTSNASIDLTGWTIRDPKSVAILPEFKIEPNRLVILCKNEHQILFSEFGEVIGLTNWPTLNNTGDQLILSTADSTTIDLVSYSVDWYQDSDKSNGGWSIEQINPLDPCPDSQNWQASQNPDGGTPGVQNSILNINPDLRGPEVVNVLVKNPQQVITFFNEKIDTKNISADNFSISPANEIESLDYSHPHTSNIIIWFKNVLQPNTLHTLTINNVTDCTGNLIQKEKNSAQFVLTVAADSTDLVINEVLFNPRSGGKDFVEIYNTSQNYINLKAWRISNSRSVTENPRVATIDSDLVLGPDGYLVITEDTAILKADYPFGKEENYYEVRSMPAMADDYGNVTLTDSLGKIMDEFDYSDSYHLSLLKDLNGVSLERVSAENPTNSRDNWHSAASAVGYATPGYENSQKLSAILVNDQIFIEPKIFVPNNDGVKDFTGINYQFEKSGYLISIYIYDLRGRMIKEIVNNGLAGVKGFYQWNGTNNANLLVAPGYYIVLVDILDPTGTAFKVKKTVVVAQDF